ncbi:MAG TPA: anthranilate phosphoribosyltransferase [Gammaproteobacteria bacterium]|nr:anthranilate phosphoribosyltransferase [Gammaproteobacteria bacterium]
MISGSDTDLLMRSCIQKVATGPEFSKDLPFDEAHAAMRHILEGKSDPVQAAVLLIALRMKRETDAENAGVLQAILDTMNPVTADVDELIDVADPYDGYTRGLPMSPFLPAVFAACGVPAVTHGLEAVGPKYGVTHRKVLRAAGVEVDLSPQQAAARITDPAIGWGYVDQKHSAPRLHDLIPLRTRMVKRPVLTTVETLTGPVRGAARTHLMTGYVHKAYPPVYAQLARHAGFASAAIIRGVEGGVIPSLKQPALVFCYHDGGAKYPQEVHPGMIGIVQQTRAVPLPQDNAPDTIEGSDTAAFDSAAAAQAAAAAGLSALQGIPGAARDSLVYGAAIMLHHLHHLRRHATLEDAAAAVAAVIDSGAALSHFTAARG